MQMNRNRQMAINLIASGVAFAVNLGISFFLSPYIIRSIGVEAYGFVALGSNFVSYAALLTIALNSMASRFITIEIHRERWDRANMYFSSVVLANVLAAAVMTIPAIWIVIYLDRVVQVPAAILRDVQILFAFLFANFLVSIILSSFGVAVFALNKLYLRSLRSIEAHLIRCGLIIFLFWQFPARVSYLGFTALIMVLYTEFFNVYYTLKLLPEMRVARRFFNAEAIRELVMSGIWNTVVRLGQLLLAGLDLLIANVFIDPVAMGTLAVAKTIPNIITNFVGMIAGIFMPEFTILYAQEKRGDLLIALKRSMKILGVLVNIPIALLAVFGQTFFSLWVPGQDARLLQILSLITVGTLIVSGSINGIYSIFTVTNRLKANALVVVLTGVINVGVVYALLQWTDLGIFAVAGVSTVLSLIRNLAFTAPYGAICLGLKWDAFFPEIFKSVAAFGVVVVLGLGFQRILMVSDWRSLFFAVVLTGFCGLGLNVLLILNARERKFLQDRLLRSVRGSRD